MHRVRKDVPINLFEFIIREDSAGPKQVLAATAQLVEFPHATECVGRFLAMVILTTEVHVLEFLVCILINLVSGVSVVPQVRGHQHSQFFVVCSSLVRGIRITITNQPLEIRESLPGQTLLQFFKSPEVVPCDSHGLADYLKPIEGLH